jgi:3-hydroxyacyl-[acyl-carrier-protein] dehydratase
MRQIDRVVWINEEATKAIGVKLVRDDEFWVPGHVPGRPLLPGVIMIEAAAQLSSVLYQYRQKFEYTEFLGFTRVDHGIFRGTVEPGQTLILLAKEKKFQRRRFSCFAQGLVDGNVVFEVQCTGMRM